MELTGKTEDVVVIALHDAENNADNAVMLLLEGGDEQVFYLKSILLMIYLGFTGLAELPTSHKK